MRRLFADLTLERMRTDERIWVITADLGYKMWDAVRDTFPARFVNPGAAEQLCVDMAIGLALCGKIPIVYSITPFLLCRPFESLRTYVNHERIPVKLVGAGRDRDYGHDGFSHWAEDDVEIMGVLRNIHALYPLSKEQMAGQFDEFVESSQPCYMNLKR